MNFATLSRLLAATGIGALYGWLAIRFWRIYVVDNPINNWLIDVFARRGHESAYFISLYTHDLIINTLLAVPAAGLIVMLKPENIRIFVIVALGAAMTVGFWGSYWPGLITLLGVWSFWVGNVLFAAALPLAVVFVTTVRRLRYAT